MNRIDYIKMKKLEELLNNEVTVEEEYTAEFCDEESAIKYLEAFSDDEFDKTMDVTYNVSIVRKKEEPKEWVEVVHKEYSIGNKKYLLSIQEK